MGASSLCGQIEGFADPQEPAANHLLAAQDTELLRLPSARTPELKLMGAVLENAIRCFCGCADSPGVRSKKLFYETVEWFESHDASWPMAFENICDALAIEPDWIRGLLTRWRNARKSAASWPAAIPSVHLRIAGSRHRVRATGRGPRPSTAGAAPLAARVEAGW